MQRNMIFYHLSSETSGEQIKELRNKGIEKKIQTIKRYALFEIICHTRSMAHVIKIEYELMSK